jgi:hypothetical protein
MLAYFSSRNYDGYCTLKLGKAVQQVPVEQDRGVQSCIVAPLKRQDLYGYRFTTEERFDIALNHYLCNQGSMDYPEIKEAENIKGYSIDETKNRFALILYGSKNEFLRENPGCCDLIPYWTKQNRFGYEFLLFRGDPSPGNERATGMGNGMFAFKHRVRYLDRERNSKKIKTTKTYIYVGNCGFPSHDFVSESIGY